MLEKTVIRPKTEKRHNMAENCLLGGHKASSQINCKKMCQLCSVEIETKKKHIVCIQHLDKLGVIHTNQTSMIHI